MRRCVIVGAGELSAMPDVRGGDLVIAADGGYMHLSEHGVRPDILIGDFDSLTGELPRDVEVIRHPVEKDETDMMLAYREGYARGCREFAIFGGTGGRLDHTLANLSQLLKMKKDGCRAELIGNGYRAYVLHGESVFRRAREGTLISVFAMGEKAVGVTLRGLKYSAESITLTADFPLGVSNSFTADEAYVSVDDGFLLVIEGLSHEK